jgi:hypothetical protein
MDAIDRVIEELTKKERAAYAEIERHRRGQEEAAARWYPWVEALEVARKVKLEGQPPAVAPTPEVAASPAPVPAPAELCNHADCEEFGEPLAPEPRGGGAYNPDEPAF